MTDDTDKIHTDEVPISHAVFTLEGDDELFAPFDDKYHEIFKRRELMGKMDDTIMAGMAEYPGIVKQAMADLGSQHQYDAGVNAVDCRKTMNHYWDLGVPSKFPNLAELEAQVDETIISIKTDIGTNIYVHIFRPKCLEGNDHACLIQCHGGGGVYWEPAILRPAMIDLAIKWGVVLVAPAYRRAPEFKAPAGSNDCRKTILHMYNNADKFGINKNRIGVTGTSGGALMALGSALIMSKIEEEKNVLKAVWVEAPATTNAWGEIPDEKITDAIDKQMKKGCVDCMRLHCHDYEKQLAEGDTDVFPGRMSVEEAAQLPPVYVLTAEKDHCRRDAYATARTLDKAGKLAGFCDWPGGMHGFRMDVRLDIVKEFLEEWRQSILKSLA